MTPRPVRRRRLAVPALLVAAGSVLAGMASPAAAATSYQRISGEGSSWAANAIDAMRVNVKQFGITVDYNPSGSTAGRKNFLNGTVDFAASDIPFQFKPEDGSAPETPAAGSYAYMPVTAGGTAFMYNLKINGQRVTNLRLSGENAVKLFTGVITKWNDPAIQKDNPGLVMPARKVVPVVRSDGSGSSAQLTKWMIATRKPLWDAYCKKSGRAPACGFTSFYPTVPGMIAQSGDLGIAGYVSQGFAEGAIGYVNYSYALGSQFPVVKLLNAAGVYTEPTPQNVAVALLKAKINTNAADPTVYLTQDLSAVYTDKDPRSYQLSSYSYLILPMKVQGQFNEAKGKTLAAFSYYAMCQAQQQSESLGYSPMPINLVKASFDQIKKIPGAVVQNINVTSCKNPTFSADGTNTLAKSAPQPKACDKAGGVSQCPDGTAGMKNVPTAVKAGGAAGGGNNNGGGGGTQTTVAGGGNNNGGGGGTQTTVAGGNGNTGSTTPGVTVAPGDTTPGGGTDPGGSVPTDTSNTGGGVPLDTTATCDPNLGCESAGGDPQVGAVLPTTLSLQTSQATSFALILLIAILVIALVLAPALAWRYFSSKAAGQ
jgi:phosphate transport system substrate-binding protein